jgi:hypothetical protein
MVRIITKKTRRIRSTNLFVSAISSRYADPFECLRAPTPLVASMAGTLTLFDDGGTTRPPTPDRPITDLLAGFLGIPVHGPAEEQSENLRFPTDSQFPAHPGPCEPDESSTPDLRLAGITYLSRGHGLMVTTTGSRIRKSFYCKKFLTDAECLQTAINYRDGFRLDLPPAVIDSVTAGGFLYSHRDETVIVQFFQDLGISFKSFELSEFADHGECIAAAKGSLVSREAVSGSVGIYEGEDHRRTTRSRNSI